MFNVYLVRCDFITVLCLQYVYNDYKFKSLCALKKLILKRRKLLHISKYIKKVTFYVSIIKKKKKKIQEIILKLILSFSFTFMCPFFLEFISTSKTRYMNHITARRIIKNIMCTLKQNTSSVSSETHKYFYWDAFESKNDA